MPVSPDRSPGWAYCDTSAIGSRYFNEPGRARLKGLLKSRRVVSSVLLPLELQSAIARRVREGTLSSIMQLRLVARIGDHRRFWTLIGLTSEVIAATEGLLEIQYLRTLDAIHVASAQVFAAKMSAPLIFLTADKRQEQAALSAGLVVRRIG